MVWEQALSHGYARGLAADAAGNVWAAGHAGRHLYQLRATDGAILSSIATIMNWPLCGVLIDANSSVWTLGNRSSSTPAPAINKWYRANSLLNAYRRSEKKAVS